LEQLENVQPLVRRAPHYPVIQVVAVNKNDGSQNIHSPEMTKPPEGGLPPQEHLT
jgi:hypothetical protein